MATSKILPWGGIRTLAITVDMFLQYKLKVPSVPWWAPPAQGRCRTRHMGSALLLQNPMVKGESVEGGKRVWRIVKAVIKRGDLDPYTSPIIATKIQNGLGTSRIAQGCASWLQSLFGPCSVTGMKPGVRRVTSCHVTGVSIALVPPLSHSKASFLPFQRDQFNVIILAKEKERKQNGPQVQCHNMQQRTGLRVPVHSSIKMGDVFWKMSRLL